MLRCICFNFLLLQLSWALLPGSLPVGAQESSVVAVGAPYEAAAPWTAPPGTTFPYTNLENDLTRLLEVQASEHRWISMVTMTAKIKRFVVNCLYSLHKYGKQPHYMVATFDDISLAECKRLNLPCLNATMFSQQRIEDGDHGFGSQHAVAMWWAKQTLTTELIRRNYNVHASDVDVVYFRNMNLSYDRIFSDTKADGIFAAEEGGPGEPWEPVHPSKSYINLINAGVYAIQANNRTLDFMLRWTAPEGRKHMDQVYLNHLHTEAYVFCTSHSTCRSAQGHGKFALFRHQFFFPGTSCIQNIYPPDNSEPDPCNPRRLYLHFLCTCCWDAKSKCWEHNRLWFVDTNLKPMYTDGGGSEQHPFMPCKEEVAWPNWKLYT